jgi:radical SAM protein with 4Fe4S-binding SPASM domain
VIIPTYGRPKQLAECLDALALLEYPADRYEVIVVDDGSEIPPTSQVTAVQDRLNVILLHQSHKGPAAARNLGAERSKGDFLAFIDDDCVPSPVWLAALAGYFEKVPDHAVGGRIVTMLHNPFSAASQIILDIVYDDYHGEPLLHPQLPRVLEIMRKQKITTFLSTNGQRLMNHSVAHALVEFPPTHLIVAIDGLTDETNSVFRSGARLKPVLDGVRQLADIKKQRSQQLPILHMRYMVMQHNQHEMPRLQEFAGKHGFDLLTIRTLSVIDAEAPDAMLAEYIPDMCEFRAYRYKNESRIRRNDEICQNPFWFPCVFADGTVTVCEQDYNGQARLGVLDQSVSFRDLWFSKKAARVRKAIRDNPESFSFCVNCPYWDRPATGCSVQAMHINRELPNPVVIA